MLTLEYKLDGTLAQYAAIEDGIRVVQFIRNKCLRAWMDHQPEGKTFEAMSAFTAVLAKQVAFVSRLGSQARQASAERAWSAVSRFDDNCKQHVPGKKGYPRFQHDCRSIECDMLPMRTRRGFSGYATDRMMSYIHARERLKGLPGPKRTLPPSPGERSSKTTLAQAERTSSKGRYCFYPWERFTTEPANSMELARCKSVLSTILSDGWKSGKTDRTFVALRPPGFHPSLLQERGMKAGRFDKATAGWSLTPDGRHITFSDGLGIGTLRLVGTRMKNCDKKQNMPLRSPAAYALPTIKRIRIVRRADGYFCQFCIAVCRVTSHEESGVERGVDVGLNAYYTESEGGKVENPRFFRKAERKVTQLQRQVSCKSVQHKQDKKSKASRKHNTYPKGQPVIKQPRQHHQHWHTYPTKGQTLRRNQRPKRVVQPVVNRNIPPEQRKQSHNYQKARKRLAQAHLKVQRQREDFARKRASALVTSSDLIAFEDLQIRNLVRNHRLAKSINDAAWGRFLWWVQYYASMQAVPCIAVPPQFTSQDCSGILPDGSRCLARVTQSLSVRTHICPRCGLVLDRDVNSGRLLKERALHLLEGNPVSVPLGRRKRPGL
jgi:IS605 OrfB family transposase